jgi:hypothetical protein
MAQTRKSIIDEAFMEAESIEKAFKANSKEILTHTMGSEIEEMVKESLEGSNGLKEDEDEENVDLELDIDSDEAGLDAGDDLDLELGDEDDEDMDMEFDLDDEDMDMDSEEDFEVIDLTQEDDDTVVTVFKKMAPEDEIEVTQTGDGVEIKDNETGAEYRIDLGGNSEMEMDDMDLDIDLDDEEMDMEDDEEMDMEDDEDMDMEDDEMAEEVVYEVYMDDDMDYMDDDMDYMEDDMEDDMKEASRTLGSGKKFGRKGLDKPKAAPRHLKAESKAPKFLKLVNENKVLKNKMSSIASENKTLKEDYNKMVDALKEFRQKLNEVAVFNSNLTYTVRLFTEHSTTKNEKVDIIKRFDEVNSLKESKTTYKNLVKEISKTKAPIRESIDNKLNETKSSGSAAQITESKVYVDPQIEKMKKLWSYDYKK